MIITKEWLHKAILIDEKIGNYSISQKQTDLLYKWFPDLFYEEETKTKKSFVKDWPDLLCKKEISESQANVFIQAKMDKYEAPHYVSETLKIHIDRALERYREKYGEEPKRPQLRLISLIGHMEGVHIQEIFFFPEPNISTQVRFYFQAKTSDDPITYWVICSSSKLIEKNGKKCPETILYKEIPREIIDNSIPIYGDKVKDCTGLEITDCINEFRPKKKIVIIKRKPKMPKPIKEDPGLKALRKNMENFNNDFESINEKRIEKGLEPITVKDFGAAFNIDPQDPFSVMKYNPSHAALKNLLD